MNKRHWTALFVLGGTGFFLQVLGIMRFFAPGVAEVNLLAGIFLFLGGTILSVWAAEYAAVAKGRSGAWALLGFLGPAGPVAAAILKERPARTALPPRGRAPRKISRSRRAAGGLLTLLFSAGFVWLAVQWAGLVRVPSASDRYRQMLDNERRTFRWIQKIVQAQESYRARDWDGDGEKMYARFLVHLWQSVDAEGNPIAVRLIPRNLGFAMAPTLPLDGYTYQSLYYRRLPPEEIQPYRPGTILDAPYGARRFGAAEEWALFAFSYDYETTEGLSFLIHGSEGIHAKVLKIPVVEIYPLDPASEGWVKISDREDLEDLQGDLEKERGPFSPASRENAQLRK